MAYTKTIWVDNSLPSINATNLNNIENGIETNDIAIAQTTSVVTGLKGQLLWENENPTTAITEDTLISLNSNDYDVYEIIYAYNTSNLIDISVKALKGKGCLLLVITNTGAIRRIVEYVSDTRLRIRTQEGGQNEYAIPQYVIGYKTGLYE